MTSDWRNSPAHTWLLTSFLRPHPADRVLPKIDWVHALDEEPAAAIERFIEAGLLVRAPLLEHLTQKFTVPELKNMLRTRDLPLTGRKDELIARLVLADPDGMTQALGDFTVWVYSDAGRQIAEPHFEHHRSQPSETASPFDSIGRRVITWVLATAATGIVGNAAYDGLGLSKLFKPSAPALTSPDDTPPPVPRHLPAARNSWAPRNTWSNTELVPGAVEGREPSLIMQGRLLHLIWMQNRALYHITRRGSVWSRPIRIAAGEQPTVVVGPDQRLHCLFSQQFAGSYEIYHLMWDGLAWSRPLLVSRTAGSSRWPALAVSGNGTLHAVWSDTTAGYSTIYYGCSHFGGSAEQHLWFSQPIPSGRGSYPTVAVAPNGDIYVAWQDRGVGDRFAVFCTVFRDSTWSVPENVSADPDTHSIFPQITVDYRSTAHLIWRHEAAGLFQMSYSRRLPGGWTPPITLSPDGQDIRQSRIAITHLGRLRAFWTTGSIIACMEYARISGSDAWAWNRIDEDTVYRNCDNGDLAVATDHGGRTHAVWTGWDAAGLSRLYYACR